MPISTNHYGVLFLGSMAIVASLLVALPGDRVSAAPAQSVSRSTGTKSTTKGVRTSTAYQKRQTSPKVSKTTAIRSVALPPEAPADVSSQEIVERAKAAVGSRYRWGGTNKATGFDCSGLVKHVFGERASDLPRTSAGLYSAVAKPEELRPGDLVFFGRGARVSHVGVYIGEGNVVHASTYRTGVRVDNVQTLSRALVLKGVGRI